MAGRALGVTPAAASAQLQSGRWQVRVHDRATGRHVPLGTFPTKEDANAALAAELTDQNRGRWVAPQGGHRPASLNVSPSLPPHVGPTLVDALAHVVEPSAHLIDAGVEAPNQAIQPGCGGPSPARESACSGRGQHRRSARSGLALLAETLARLRALLAQRLGEFSTSRTSPRWAPRQWWLSPRVWR